MSRLPGEMPAVPPSPRPTLGRLARELLRQTLVVACGWMILMLPLSAVVLTAGTLASPGAPRRHDPPIALGLVGLAVAAVWVAIVAVRGPLRGWWAGRAGAAPRSLLCLAGVLAAWVPWVFVDVAAYYGA